MTLNCIISSATLKVSLPPAPEDIIELALPDGPASPAECTDPFCSKLGGLPAFLLEKEPDLKCQVCQTPMFLVLQMDCPREEFPGVDRVAYVFGCNSRACSQRPEGWKVIFQSRLQEVQSKEAVKTEKVSFWDSLMTDSEGSLKEDDAKATSKDAISKTTSNPSSKTTSNLSSKTTSKATPSKATPSKTNANHFPAIFLHIEEELFIEKSGGAKQKKDLPPTTATAEEDWSGEQYEKFHVPGTDASFNRFQKRVANYPRQCVRYCVAQGPSGNKKLLPQQPPACLPFRDCDWREEMGKLPGCAGCAQPLERFELQLMPAILAFLPTEHDAHLKHIPGNKRSENPLISDGMEWGTVMVFSCAQCLMEEQAGAVIIQLEQ